ncbi:hypothetical protein DMR_10120 [Solidesulfovibrio magneticus RS-1]|uniref:Uncharacterized protein n=2 Tax=Solidesulfovibrio TaxID=2910984 RepID=C4XKW4_SOLM1|nr:hypothetical protein DMR_10120 [Solidesulfovibrio magneticus RS-1]
MFPYCRFKSNRQIFTYTKPTRRFVMSKKEDQPAKGMKLESKYNPTLLRECIKNNNSASEIMEKLGITHKQTLKQYVLKLMSDDRHFYEVKGMYVKSSTRPKVNKNNEIKLYLKNLGLEELQLVEGDEFTVMVENGSIVLTKIEH